MIETQNGAHFAFEVEVATTALQQTTGLMFRRTVPPDGGMLFSWPRAWVAEMWMKDTLVQLDMLFIRADGGIDTLVRNATPQSTTIIGSRDAVVATLELAGGTADRLGIREGDRVLGLPPPPYPHDIPMAWPSFQAKLTPGTSTSSIPAALPPGLSVAPPGPDVSPMRRRWLGHWTGWLGRDRGGSVRLVVMRLTATGGEALYAYANGARGVASRSTMLRLDAVGDDEMRGVSAFGGSVALHLRPDSNLDMMLSEGILWATGVLSRD